MHTSSVVHTRYQVSRWGGSIGRYFQLVCSKCLSVRRSFNVARELFGAHGAVRCCGKTRHVRWWWYCCCIVPQLRSTADDHNETLLRTRPMRRTGQHKTLCKGAGLIGQGWPFGRPDVFLEKSHQNTRRGRVTAPADLEPPKGVGSGFGFGLGLGQGSDWSGPTCKVEINDTLPAQRFRADQSCT